MNQDLSKEITVFDIETIPDSAIANRLLDKQLINENDAIVSLKQYFLERSEGRSDFPKIPFHKVINLSYLIAKVDVAGQHLFYNTTNIEHPFTNEEEQIVQLFFKRLDKLNKKTELISYNGKDFDIPVLIARAMKYNISAPAFHQPSTSYHDTTYIGGKFYGRLHIDLVNSIWDFANIKTSLDDLCVMLNLPGKVDVAGDRVLELYLNGQHTIIANYCDFDVLNTYLVYLKFALHNGRLSRNGYNLSVKSLVDYLVNSHQEHFQQFVNIWYEYQGGNISI